MSVIYLSRAADALILSEWTKHEYCLSIPRVEAGLILSEWTKQAYCLSLPEVEDVLILSKYIRVSFVSLSRVKDGLLK